MLTTAAPYLNIDYHSRPSAADGLGRQEPKVQ